MKETEITQEECPKCESILLMDRHDATVQCANRSCKYGKSQPITMVAHKGAKESLGVL